MLFVRTTSVPPRCSNGLHKSINHWHVLTLIGFHVFYRYQHDAGIDGRYPFDTSRTIPLVCKKN